MIKLLAKLFIKNSQDVKNPEVRSKYGILTGVVGICFNFLLFAGKLLAGIFSKSVSVIADAFNNLSDAAASIVTIIGFKLSSKKPDKDHPFGHGRLEYIAGLIVSFLILMVGFELMKSSIGAIIHPEALDSSYFTIAALVVSILVKFYMYAYNRGVAKKIDSAAMMATAKDSLNDCISTTVVLICIIVTKLFPELKVPLDGIAGVVVAVFILMGGYESVKETIDPLLGQKADPEFVKEIEETVMEFKPICGIHDLIVHDYGPGRLMISLHAEVPGDEDIFELHEVIDQVELELCRKFGCAATIHMDPVDIKNEELLKIKDFLKKAVSTDLEGVTIHDLRMVPGEKRTNVIFDAVRPHSCPLSEAELREYFEKKVKEYNSQYFAVIQIDQEFV